MSVKLLTEYHLEFLSLRGGSTGSPESIHVKMPHCWKFHVTKNTLTFEQLSHFTSNKIVTLKGGHLIS